MRLLLLLVLAGFLFPSPFRDSDEGRDVLNGVCEKYDRMSETTFEGIQSFTDAKGNCKVVVPFEFKWGSSSPSIKFSKPDLPRRCFDLISEDGGFDLPGWWTDIRLANLGVESATLLPPEVQLDGDNSVRCRMLDVVYGDYYVQIRKIKNPIRYWIDVATNTVRRVEFTEMRDHGERDWTVTIDRVISDSSSSSQFTNQDVVITSPGKTLSKLAPDFESATDSGAPVHLSALRGKIVILVFWATWCGPCLEEIPTLEALQLNEEESQLEVLGVSEEDAPTVKNWEHTYRRSFKTLVNASSTFEAYGIKPIPTTVVIDRNGVVVDFIVGFQTPAKLRELVAKYQHN
jgi:thiol-disulfide isomerase/thioredoxin